jgi:zinc/manganese transport system permease protein
MAVLFIHLYPGRAGTSFALLTGQIVGVGYSGLALLIAVTVAVVVTLAASYRPLLFATADPEVAAARGVPVRALGIVFAALVGIVAAQGVQIVGAWLQPAFCRAGFKHGQRPGGVGVAGGGGRRGSGRTRHQ